MRTRMGRYSAERSRRPSCTTFRHEVLDAAELRRRYPVYAGLDPAKRVVWQPDGGFLLAERTILAHVNGALAAGADLRFREGVSSWEATADGGVRVIGDRATYEADRLVICAGAWARQLMPRLSELARPTRRAPGRALPNPRLSAWPPGKETGSPRTGCSRW